MAQVNQPPVYWLLYPWGQKGQCITKDSSQQLPISVNAVAVISCYLQQWDTVSLFENRFADVHVFSHSGRMFTHPTSCESNNLAGRLIWGISFDCVCMKKFYLTCFVSVLYAWAARASGVTHTTLNSEGVGFLPSRVWLDSSSYCYQAVLITNSFTVFTLKVQVAG